MPDSRNKGMLVFPERYLVQMRQFVDGFGCLIKS
jgi:hypothetical protein